jgi:hypothetical protein
MSYFCRPVEHYPFFLVSPHLFFNQDKKLLKELNFIGTVSFCSRSCGLPSLFQCDDYDTVTVTAPWIVVIITIGPTNDLIRESVVLVSCRDCIMKSTA